VQRRGRVNYGMKKIRGSSFFEWIGWQYLKHLKSYNMGRHLKTNKLYGVHAHAFELIRCYRAVCVLTRRWCQTGTAYSSTGRMTEMKQLGAGNPRTFKLFQKIQSLLPLIQMASTCVCQERLESMWTPSRL